MKLDELLDKGEISQAGLAAALGVSQGMVWQWVHGRRRVPADRCPDIEAATGGAVTCEELRPDVSWHVLRNAPPIDCVRVHADTLPARD